MTPENCAFLIRAVRYYAGLGICIERVRYQAMVHVGVSRFIFSSTAAIYGNPDYVSIDEAHPKASINPSSPPIFSGR